MGKQMNENDGTRPDTDSYLEEKSSSSDVDSKKDSTTVSHDQPNELSDVKQSLVALQDLFEKQIARNTNQTEMFDKIYAEMKEYKESFLLEVLHKPIIHNLIQLYDSFVALESQFEGICGGNEEKMFDELAQYRKNLENFRFKLEEVLYRMDVTPFADSSDTLDRQLHKTRQVIPSDDPEQDRKIAEVHKIGFNWREKVFRPEEVTIYRYTPSAQQSEDILKDSSSSEKGGRTDG